MRYDQVMNDAKAAPNRKIANRKVQARVQRVAYAESKTSKDDETCEAGQEGGIVAGGRRGLS